MRTVLVCIGLIIVLCQIGRAQCPTPSQLTDTYRAVLLRPFDEQLKPLLALQKQWEDCRQPFDSIYVGTLLQIGQGYHAQGHLDEAEAVVRRAITVCRSNTKRSRIADLTKAWYRLGVVHVYQNQTQSAIGALKKAVETGATDSEAAYWLGDTHLYLAYAYITIGDCQQTILHTDAGMPFARLIGDKGLIANLLRQKAQAFFIWGDYANAQSIILAAINNILNEKTYQQALTHNYDLLSQILASQGQYKEAIRYAERSYTIAAETHYSELPNLANNVSFLYCRVGNYPKAIQYAQYGINHAVDAFGKANAYNILGATYWRQKQFDKALMYYQQGLSVLPIGCRAQAVNTNPDKEQLRLVARKDVTLTLLQDKADTWLDYAKATNNNHQRLQHALATYRVADQMIDYMRWDQTGQQSKLFWRQKTRGMYERAIETCFRLGDAEQAFRFMEKSRAVMLADQLNELGARQQLSPAQVAQEQKLRQAVAEQQTTLAGIASDSSAYAPARANLLAKQDQLDAFIKQLEASNPAYYSNKYDNTTPALADLKRYLADRNASFVTYFVGDSALYVLGVTGQAVTLRQEKVVAYKRAVDTFMPLLNNPDQMNRRATAERFWALGQDLYGQLLRPLNLPEGRVIVSPDGVFLPFESLSRTAGRPDYAVNQYAFSYVYSARLLLKQADDAPRMGTLANRDFVGVAPVSFSARLKQVSLPGSDAALESIAGQFRSPVVLTGKAATRRAFQHAVADYRVIHLFTHATADSTETEPMLYFADSTLRLSDLGEGGLTNAQLVVLAACKTGVGADQRGEGVFSLARGFAALGVPSVLTTLWNVQNQSTYRLTELFYGYLAEGLPKDVALQRAQQEWLRTADGADQLPNAWSGLIVVGDTEPLRQPNHWAWLGGIAVFLLAIGATYWSWRRSRWLPTPAVAWIRPA